MRPRSCSMLVLAALLAIPVGGASAQEPMGQQADVVENFPTMAGGGEDLLLAENATIERSPEGITLTMRIPTPEPGSYTYPDTVPPERQAHPEVFTGWAFVFNNPEQCTTNPEPPRCGPGDFNEEVKVGVYTFGGHASSLDQHSAGDLVVNEATDGDVILTGSVMTGQEQLPYISPNAVTFPLENPEGAEVHAAIAPHGQLDVSLLPGDLYNPVGNPACECWWVAIFLPPSDQG